MMKIQKMICHIILESEKWIFIWKKKKRKEKTQKKRLQKQEKKPITFNLFFLIFYSYFYKSIFFYAYPVSVFQWWRVRDN